LDPTDEKVIEARMAIRAAEERRKKRHADKDKMADEQADRRRRMLARKAAQAAAAATGEQVERSQSRSASHSIAGGVATATATSRTTTATSKTSRRGGAAASIEANRERQRQNAAALPAPASASRSHQRNPSHDSVTQNTGLHIPVPSPVNATSSDLDRPDDNLPLLSTGMASTPSGGGGGLLSSSHSVGMGVTSSGSPLGAASLAATASSQGVDTLSQSSTHSIGMESKGDDVKWADRRGHDDTATDSKRGTSSGRLAAAMAAGVAASGKKVKRNQIQPMSIPMPSSISTAAAHASSGLGSDRSSKNGTGSGHAPLTDEQLAAATSSLTGSNQPLSLERLARAAHGDTSFDATSDTDPTTPRTPRDAPATDDTHMTPAPPTRGADGHLLVPVKMGSHQSSDNVGAHFQRPSALITSESADNVTVGGHAAGPSQSPQSPAVLPGDDTGSSAPLLVHEHEYHGAGTSPMLSVPGTVLESQPPVATSTTTEPAESKRKSRHKKKASSGHTSDDKKHHKKKSSSHKKKSSSGGSRKT
jgi:hypothetical protein